MNVQDLCEVLPTEFSVEELHQEVQTRFPAGIASATLFNWPEMRAEQMWAE